MQHGTEKSGSSVEGVLPFVRAFRHDLIALLLLFIASLTCGAIYLFGVIDLIAMRPGTSLYDFSVSLCVVLDEGFMVPDVSATPEVAQFFQQETRSLDPSQFSAPLVVEKPRPLHFSHPYLLLYVALIWRILGISWITFKAAHLILFVITCLLAYGVFRLGMKPMISLAATALFMSSPVVLEVLLSLRDFSKAAFFLCILLLLGRLLKGPASRKKIFSYAVLIGAVSGFGYGFRQDILLVLPLVLLTLGLGVQAARPLRIRTRFLAASLFLLSFLFFSFPITYNVYGEGGAQGFHDAMMGLSTDCLDRLELNHDSYELCYCYYDDLPCAMRKMRLKYHDGELWPPAWEGLRDAEQARALFLTTAWTFPADFATRALAAWHYILRHPHMRSEAPTIGRNALFSYLEVVHRPVAQLLYFAFPLAAFLSICCCAWRKPWLAALLIFFSAYLCGYTSLQFHTRHVFHLAWISLWILGFCIEKIGGYAARLCSKAEKTSHCEQARSPLPFRKGLLNISLCLLGIVVFIALSYSLLWMIQAKQVEKLLERYEEAELEALPYEKIPEEDWVRFSVKDWKEKMASLDFFRYLGADPAHARKTEEFIQHLLPLTQALYLAVEIKGSSEEYFLHLSYEESEILVLDQVLRLAPPESSGEASFRYFFPVFEMHLPVIETTAVFRGIRMPVEQADDLVNIYWVRDIPHFDFYPNLLLPEDSSLFQGAMKWNPLKRRVSTPLHLERVALLIQRAERAYEAEDLQSATHFYRSAIEMAPMKSVEAYRPLDLLLKETESLELRKEFWEKLSTQHPQNALALLFYGGALVDAKELQKAWEVYLSAERLSENDPMIPLRRGELALQRNRYQEAVEAFQRAIALNPENSYCWNQCIQALIAVGDCEKLKDFLREAQNNAIPFSPDLQDKLKESPCLEDDSF